MLRASLPPGGFDLALAPRDQYDSAFEFCIRMLQSFELFSGWTKFWSE